MFVLTRLVTVFDHEPTLNELSMFFWNRSIDSMLSDSELLFLAHLKRGGGRQGDEDE